MRSVSRVLVGLAVAAFCAAPVVAQMAGGSSTGGKGSMAVSLSGGYYTLSSSDFEDTFGSSLKGGIGGEASFRYGITPQISLQAGVGYSSHDIENSTFSVTLLRFALEPRYVFRLTSPKLAPFVGARIQYGSYTIADVGTALGGTGDAKGNGIGFGGTVGVQYTMSPSIALEGSLVFVSQKFGDADVGGTTVSASDASSTSLGLQLGVVFKFGGH